MFGGERAWENNDERRRERGRTNVCGGESACENNDERRGEGEDNVFGGERACENNDERRRERGRTNVCGGEVHARIMMRGGGRVGQCVWWRECMRE